MDDSQDPTHENRATRPNRPKDQRLERYAISEAEALPAVDWEIGVEPSPEDLSRSENVNLGLVQFPAVQDRQANLKRALRLSWQIIDEGAEIVAFPEMFMLPWVFSDNYNRYQDLSHTVDDPIWEPLQTLAQDKNVVLVCPFFERGENGRNHNSALVIDTDGTIAGCYRKHHLPPDNERIHFTRGNEPFSSFQTRKGRIGVYICWDNFFPEGARALALDGADVVFAPSAATDQTARYKWDIAIQHNALINGIPWVRINRCEPPCYSQQMVVNAAGQVIHDLSAEGDQISLVTIDYMDTHRVRHEWTFMADRRPEVYGVLGQP